MVVFQYLHLLDGNLIQLNQSFALGQALVNEHGIEVLHVRQANQLIDSGIVTDVAFLVCIRLPPLFGSHAEHRYVEHISLISINDACLLGSNLFRNDVALDGIGVYAVVDF